MLLRLLLLFIVVPLVELMLLMKIAELTSIQHTLALVVITGAIGTWLARSEGLRTLNRIRGAMAKGEMPTDSLMDGVMILVAGALLLTPGILTDAFGFSLLLPFFRKYYRAWLMRSFKGNVQIQTTFSGQAATPQQSEVIDSYVVDRPSDDARSGTDQAT